MSSSVVDLVSDDDEGSAPPSLAQPQQQQQQQQNIHAVAILCGEHGLAVCGIRTDLKVRKSLREYVLYDFELVTDAAYRGANKAAALPGMLRRSQLLQTVLAHNPQAYVVLRRHAEYPGADSFTQKAIQRGQREGGALARTIARLHPQAQLLDILRDSTSTAVSHFLDYSPKKQARAAVTGSSSAAAAAAGSQAPSSGTYQKVQRKTREGLVDAAQQLLGSGKCSMVDGVSDPVAALDHFQKPVDNHRDMATALWMAMYVLHLTASERAKAVQLLQANLGMGAAAPAAAAAAAAGPLTPPPAVPAAAAPVGSPAAAAGAAAVARATVAAAGAAAAAAGAAAGADDVYAALVNILTPSQRQALAATLVAAGTAPSAAPQPATAPAAPAAAAGPPAAAAAAAAMARERSRLGSQSGHQTPGVPGRSSHGAAAAAAAAAGGLGCAGVGTPSRSRGGTAPAAAAAAAAAGGSQQGGRPSGQKRARSAAAASAGAVAGSAGFDSPLMPLTQPQEGEGPAGQQQHRQHKRRRNRAAFEQRPGDADMPLPLVLQQPGSPPPRGSAGVARGANQADAICISDSD